MRALKHILHCTTASFVLLSSTITALEQQVSVEGHGAQYDKKHSWQEETVLYNFKKKNRAGDSALVSSIGVRRDTLDLHHHLHPSNYNSVLALVGAEKSYDKWLWLSTFEGLFQNPTFNPINSTRYTFEVVGSYQFTERLSGQFGAGTRFGLHTPRGYPILGLLYFVDRWKFEVLLPDSASASYQWNKKNNIGLYLLHKPRVFRADHAYGHEKAIIDFQSILAETRWTHSFSKSMTLWVGLGWNLYTRIKAGNRTYDHEKTVFHSSRGIAANLGIKKNF